MGTDFKTFERDLTLSIGKRIRQRRRELGLSQKNVAEFLNVTYQQLQKYETGIDRTAPATLLLLAQHLDVPLSYFFEGGPKLPPLPKSRTR